MMEYKIKIVGQKQFVHENYQDYNRACIKAIEMVEADKSLEVQVYAKKVYHKLKFSVNKEDVYSKSIRVGAIVIGGSDMELDFFKKVYGELN